MVRFFRRRRNANAAAEGPQKKQGKNGKMEDDATAAPSSRSSFFSRSLSKSLSFRRSRSSSRNLNPAAVDVAVALTTAVKTTTTTTTPTTKRGRHVAFDEAANETFDSTLVLDSETFGALFFNATELNGMRLQGMAAAKHENMEDLEETGGQFSKTLMHLYQLCLKQTVSHGSTVSAHERGKLRALLRSDRLGLERNMPPGLEKELQKRHHQQLNLLQTVQKTSDNRHNPDALADELYRVCERVSRPVRAFAAILAEEYYALPEEKDIVKEDPPQPEEEEKEEPPQPSTEEEKETQKEEEKEPQPKQ